MSAAPPRPVEFFANWSTMSERDRFEIIDSLREEASRVAFAMGAETEAEIRAVCEAVGLALLAEAGWGIIALRGGEET